MPMIAITSSISTKLKPPCAFRRRPRWLRAHLMSIECNDIEVCLCAYWLVGVVLLAAGVDLAVRAVGLDRSGAGFVDPRAGGRAGRAAGAVNHRDAVLVGA